MNNFFFITIFYFLLYSCEYEKKLGTIKTQQSEIFSVSITYKYEDFERKYPMYYQLYDENSNKISELNYFYTCYDDLDVTINDFKLEFDDSSIFIISKWDNQVVSI